MKYIGIDWATDRHDVSLVDESGTQVDSWQITHSPVGVAALLERLAKEGESREVLVGLESGALLLLGALLRAGYQVYVINPKQSDRFRDRYSVAGAKDDKLDAFVLANAVRTDRAHLRPFEPDTPLAEEIGLRERARMGLVQTRAALENQLRHGLLEYFPALLSLGRAMNDPFFLELLRLTRDPVRARLTRMSSLERLVAKHRLRVLNAKGLLDLLRGPAFDLPEHVRNARRDGALHLASVIEILNEQIEKTEEDLDELAKRHPDYELLQSLPGLGNRSVVRVLAELGDSPSRRADATRIQTYAGSAPVTRKTGKHGRKGNVLVLMRRGCNRILQAALFNMARASVVRSAWAASYLEHCTQTKVPRVKALRSLSNKWAKILWAVLYTRRPYDEDRHVADLRRQGVEWAPRALVAA